MLTNTHTRYGLVAVFLHWLIALGILGEFVLGLYITDMGYADPMSQLLPHLHESVGILLAGAIFFRLLWAVVGIRPEPGTGIGPLEYVASRIVQWSMQIIVIAVVVLGYLLSTAKGAGVSVFGWFTLPAILPSDVKGEENLALFLHYWLAWTLIILAGVHMLGALKHHFIDRDETLRNMLGLEPATPANKHNPSH